MSASDQVFYLRQAVKRPQRFSALSPSVREREVILHFYVKSDDSSNAGGAAGSFCVAEGIECVEYICLPEPISRTQISEHEREHIEAYELAQREGFAVVASVVISWETK